jgi:hypothetical protein
LIAAKLSAPHTFSAKILQSDGMSTVSANKPKFHIKRQRTEDMMLIDERNAVY